MSIEWNGEGSPPVGVKCEHCPGGTTQTEWGVVTVAGIYENPVTGFTDYWLVKENGSSYTVGNPYRFRPLRTEEERKREEVIKAITDSIIDFDLASVEHRGDEQSIAIEIYCRIEAGRIPHVTLK